MHVAYSCISQTHLGVGSVGDTVRCIVIGLVKYTRYPDKGNTTCTSRSMSRTREILRQHWSIFCLFQYIWGTGHISMRCKGSWLQPYFTRTKVRIQETGYIYFGKSHHRYYILPGQGTCPLLRIRTLSETQIYTLKTVILVNIHRICPQTPIWHQTILHYDRSFWVLRK